MYLLMPALTRAPNGDHFSRKVIPPDIRDAYEHAYGVRQEARFRLAAEASPAEAARAHLEWITEVNARIGRLRAAVGGRPSMLSQRELHQLSSRWYAWFVAAHERDPGTAEQWDHAAEQLQDVREGAGGIGHPDEPDDQPIGSGHRRRIRAKLEELASVPSFLAADGTVLTSDSLGQFLDDALPADFGAALQRLRRLAEGRAGADEHLAKLGGAIPSVVKMSKKRAGWTSWEAFAAWVAEAKPRPSTINRWRGVFRHLDAFLEGRDLADVTRDDIVRWKDELVAGDAGARTIKDIWLNSARTVFNYVVAQGRIEANPAAGVKLAGFKKIATKGEFKEEDALSILRATLAPRSAATSEFLRAAIRWVPWLCAYTGARPGEMTQLRKQDVEQHRDGFWVAHIRSEAGTVKGQVDRTVVLHDHLLAQGFIDFVAKATPGPLFYGPSRAATKAIDPLNPPRQPYVIARQKLADWVRNEVGVKDTGVSPNHAWRHTFKRRAARAGIEQRIRDAYCGHSDGRVGASYETPSVEDLAQAIKVSPRLPSRGRIGASLETRTGPSWRFSLPCQSNQCHAPVRASSDAPRPCPSSHQRTRT